MCCFSITSYSLCSFLSPMLITGHAHYFYLWTYNDCIRGICSEMRKFPLLLHYPLGEYSGMEAHNYTLLTVLCCLQHHITNQTSREHKCKQVNTIAHEWMNPCSQQIDFSICHMPWSMSAAGNKRKSSFISPQLKLFSIKFIFSSPGQHCKFRVWWSLGYLNIDAFI